MAKSSLSMLAFGLWMSLCGSLHAAEVPALLEIPGVLAEPENSKLHQMRASLKGRASELKQEVNELNKACKDVDRGSAAEARCLNRQSAFRKNAQDYGADAADFNRGLAPVYSILRRKQGDSTAKVLRIEGDVYVRTSAGNVKLGTSIVLQTGDEIVTGPKSRTEIELEGGSRTDIGAESRITLSELRGGFSFALAYGKVRVWAVRLQGRRYQLRTNNIVAGVRGTEFEVIQNQERTELKVYSGTVEVTSIKSKKTTSVTAGWRVRVNADGTTTRDAIDDPGTS